MLLTSQLPWVNEPLGLNSWYLLVLKSPNKLDVFMIMHDAMLTLILSLCVSLPRFGLWSRDYIYRADFHREGQRSECEAGLPVHSGP